MVATSLNGNIKQCHEDGILFFSGIKGVLGDIGSQGNIGKTGPIGKKGKLHLTLLPWTFQAN